MSVAMGYGSLFATVITLYLVPMCYLVLEDLMRLFVSRPKSPATQPELLQNPEATS
jgi:hypothetical protein